MFINTQNQKKKYVCSWQHIFWGPVKFLCFLTPHNVTIIHLFVVTNCTQNKYIINCYNTSLLSVCNLYFLSSLLVITRISYKQGSGPRYILPRFLAEHKIFTVTVQQLGTVLKNILSYCISFCSCLKYSFSKQFCKVILVISTLREHVFQHCFLGNTHALLCTRLSLAHILIFALPLLCCNPLKDDSVVLIISVQHSRQLFSNKSISCFLFYILFKLFVDYSHKRPISNIACQNHDLRQKPFIIRL